MPHALRMSSAMCTTPELGLSAAGASGCAAGAIGTAGGAAAFCEPLQALVPVRATKASDSDDFILVSLAWTSANTRRADSPSLARESESCKRFVRRRCWFEFPVLERARASFRHGVLARASLDNDEHHEFPGNIELALAVHLGSVCQNTGHDWSGRPIGVPGLELMNLRFPTPACRFLHARAACAGLPHWDHLTCNDQCVTKVP